MIASALLPPREVPNAFVRLLSKDEIVDEYDIAEFLDYKASNNVD